MDLDSAPPSAEKSPTRSRGIPSFARISATSYGFAWAIAAQVVGLVGGLLTFKVWTAYLLPQELGLMGLVIGAASILVGISIGPLIQSVFVSYASYAENARSSEFRAVVAKMLTRRMIVTVILVLVGGVGFAVAFNSHWAMPLAIAGFVVIDARRSFEEILFAAARRQREVALIAIVDVWIRLAFVWLFLHFVEPTAFSAICGNLLGDLLVLIAIRQFLRLEAFPSASSVADCDRTALSEEIGRLAGPLLPSMILANLTGMANRYIISWTIGLQAAGVFVASYGLVTRPYGMFNHITSITMTPLLAHAVAGEDVSRARKIRRYWLAAAFAGATVGVCLFVLLRESIVAILLSRQFSAAGDLFFGLAVAMGLLNVSNVFNWFLTIMGKTQFILFSNAACCVVTLSLTVILCPVLDVIGAVWALVAGYLLQLILLVRFYRRSSAQARGGRSKAVVTIGGDG